MFFMIGVNEKSEELDYDELITCDNCGAYGRLSVFMTYTVLLLFFIPCFKWNKHYYVRTSCCGRVYELDPEIGRRIAGGEQIDITDSDLRDSGYGSGPMLKTCSYCGYSTYEDFRYCPKCGRYMK